MQFKHKFMYFCAGCAFVVMAQVLLSVLVPQVTAQGKKNLVDLIQEQSQKTVEFDTVKVRSLQVVDNSGKVRAQLEVTKRECVAPVDDIIQVFNRAGVLVYRVGVVADSTSGSDVTLFGNDGKIYTVLGVSQNSGTVTLYGDKSAIRVWGGESEICVWSGKGFEKVCMRQSTGGGIVSVLGDDGSYRVAVGVNKDGHGVVQTHDKDGVFTEILGGISADKSTSSTSTSQKEEEFKDVKLFPSKPFVEIGRGYAVRNILFRPHDVFDWVTIIGEVRTPAYVSTSQLTAQFTISLFDASGKYLGGKQFDVYGVVPKGGVYPFRALVSDVVSKNVEYCQIRPKGAWGPKRE